MINGESLRGNTGALLARESRTDRSRNEMPNLSHTRRIKRILRTVSCAFVSFCSFHLSSSSSFSLSLPINSRNSDPQGHTVVGSPPPLPTTVHASI